MLRARGLWALLPATALCLALAPMAAAAAEGEINLNGIARSVSLFDQLIKVCPPFIPLDLKLARQMASTFIQVGTKSAGAGPFGGLLSHEIPRREQEVQITGPAQWCAYQKGYLTSAGSGSLFAAAAEPAPAPEPNAAAAPVGLLAISIAPGLTSQKIVEQLQAANELTGTIDSVPVEGILLPETYKFTPGDSRASIIDRMVREHALVVADVWQRRAGDLPLKAPHELVILASMIEKESALGEEYARIAAVFEHRLKLNMPLQSDPTVIYGMFRGAGTPTGFLLSQSDIQKPSDYNTYLNPGLPRGPIGNPSRAALEAAANPAQTRDLFFSADGKGGHLFAETHDQLMQNIAQWKATNADAAPIPAATADAPSADLQAKLKVAAAAAAATAQKHPASGPAPAGTKPVVDAQDPTQTQKDLDQINALLAKKKLEQMGVAKPPPGSSPSVGTQIGPEVLDAVRTKLAQCWAPPLGWTDPAQIRVVVMISFNRDGTIDGVPEILESPEGTYATTAPESVLRAVRRCAPFGFLPAEKYDAWKQIKVTFDPKDMGGASVGGETAADAPSDSCAIVNEDPAWGDQLAWKGECKNGFADGVGTATWSKGGVASRVEQYTHENGLIRSKGGRMPDAKTITAKTTLKITDCEQNSAFRAVSVQVDRSLAIADFAVVRFILNHLVQPIVWKECLGHDMLMTDRPVYDNISVAMFVDGRQIIHARSYGAAGPSSPDKTTWEEYGNEAETQFASDSDQAYQRNLEAARQQQAANAKAAAAARVAATQPPPVTKEVPWSISGIALGMETQDAVNAAQDIIVSDFGANAFKVDVGGLAEGLFGAMQQYPCSPQAQAAMNNGKPHSELVAKICFLSRYLMDPQITNQSLWISTVEDPVTHQSVISEVKLHLGVNKGVNWDAVTAQLFQKYGRNTSSRHSFEEGDCLVWGSAPGPQFQACYDGHSGVLDLSNDQLATAALAEWKRSSGVLDAPVLH